MQQDPRSAAASGKDFPYRMQTLCYIEVHKDGRVTHGRDNGTYERARSGESTLYAVWPGNYRSDLFIIDDLDEYAGAFGIIHDQERTGLADHVHDVKWQRSSIEDKPRAQYTWIEVELLCGCTVKDLDTFAAQMNKQKGWNVATSGGWGSSGMPGGKQTYSFRVRRKSLES
ncbi:hypothetical protein [Glycomyces albidus]|uniref:Uncharacterized protein n=1 Tax=Glycomyces albidus TaxID=2656774 RepID=A0A6L5GH18_9ACTN|nr:hypothetical protein [Glycomyces albidus]MQM28970.1 hypothetical protein [Glycomyces albidus]